MQIQRYLSKISGPLLDRIDIHTDVPEVNYKELTGKGDGEPSRVVAERIQKARKIQLHRFRKNKPPIFCNAQMGSPELNEHLKVSRTIADLDGSEAIGSPHISEAIQYRSLDRNFWHSL